MLLSTHYKKFNFKNVKNDNVAVKNNCIKDKDKKERKQVNKTIVLEHNH